VTDLAVDSVRFSVVTPVFDPDPEALRSCIRSVLGQLSTDWEWIVADDGSTDPRVLDELRMLSADPRVTVLTGPDNSGISRATNAAIECASGEYLVFLDHDDELTPDALATVSETITLGGAADVLYSDEVKIGSDGGLYDWVAKPEWSPERLRGHNYCNHLTVVRRDLVERVGGLRSEFDGAQDHDLLLRLSEVTDRFVHIPRVLYRWRATPGSTASDTTAKPAAMDAGCRAVREHLCRVGFDAEVTAAGPGRYRAKRRLSNWPSVSIVIPTRGDSRRVRGRPTNLVLNAIESIVSTTTYPSVEFVVVYDTGAPDWVLDGLRRLAGPQLTLTEWTEPFHFSRKINHGVASSSGEVIILLNDDTEVITADWIETFVGLVVEHDVGMAGPMLLLADGRIQSAGHHYAPTPLHVGAGAPADDPGPHGMFAVAGERSGVTAACAAVRRGVFTEMGGLSERFPNCYNDVDFGFKLLEAGYRIVWTPHAALFHFESLTRDPRESPAEADELRRRWGRRLGDDPYARQIDLWWADVPFFPPSSEVAVR
jgi:O-antigen biosynthesis protein